MNPSTWTINAASIVWSPVMRLGTNLGNSLTVRGIGGHRRKSAMSKLRHSDHKQYEATDRFRPFRLSWRDDSNTVAWSAVRYGWSVGRLDGCGGARVVRLGPEA